ncbi:MAG: response regulator [Holophagaceae bacterium]
MTDATQDAEFLKTLTVLYVEDEDLARTQTEAFLRRRVGKLISASNGAEGLEAFRTESVHLVVTDLLMPVMGGLAMAVEIRKLAPSTPIIVTTAFEQTDYLMSAIDIGVEKYVIKPVQSERLEAALLECAHRLAAEALFRKQAWLEAEVLRARHKESLRILTAGIAHDFNNLLQAILTAFSLAKLKVPKDSDALRSLEIGDRSSEQARVLAKRLFTLAMGSDAMDHTGSIEALVRETVTQTLVGSPIQVAFDLRCENIPIRYNLAGLRQVLASLALNAREAMPGAGDLKVAASETNLSDQEAPALHLPQGRYLHLRLSDSGPGIPAANLPMIFEPYFSTKERGAQRGMGLGLALCDTLVRSHGGAITAESVPGAGATFHLYLPVAAGG